MPKTKFEDAIYTIIMATIMVYGMIVYNVALNTGGVSGQTFLLATHEMIIMVPVAFVLPIVHSSLPMPFLSASAALCVRS